MNRYLFLIICMISWQSSHSQVLKPVEDQSSVTFRIKNLGFNVTGSFRGLQGAITFFPDNLPASSMDVSVQSKSVNTGIDMRDNHLRKEEYFDSKKYPNIRFISMKITTSTKPGTLFMYGKLTIKNVTREVFFPFTAIPQQGGYLFTGEFKINRIDYGVGESSSTADNLTVILRVFALKG